MRKFNLTFVVLLLLVTFIQASKVRRGEKRVIVEDVKASEAEQAPTSDATETATNKKEKEVHKRGIFHYGATAGSQWPKTYASHYGYGLNLPAGTVFAAHHPLTAAHHLHAAPTIKYHGHGFHYKTLAAPAVLPAATGFNSAWPSYNSLSPAVSHGHAVANAQPFIIRPGGAVVQSYSVTYPHRKPVKPIHSFASIAPVQPAVAAIQPVHSFQTVQAVQHVHPVQPVAAAQPVAGISHVHHLTPVQTLQHLPPAVPPPVQTVVQVQQLKPPFHYYDTQQQFPSFFQTSFIPPAPAVLPALPQTPVAYGPAQPAFPELPALPTFPHIPDFPNIPVIPVIPSQPAVPDVPAVPAIPSIPSIPSIPNIPTIPSIPNFPQPQVPSNGFFPVNVQPPLNQKPPAFGGIDHPVQSPDFGSENASPQIPAHPPTSGSPKPQFPDSTQTPWKPVLYEPPTADNPLDRPSNTLLPPYGSSSFPAEGYLPPASSSHSSRFQQQEYNTIDSTLFDNLSDAEIQQIFAQASLAAHRDHHHHTVHNYHTRY